MPVIVSCSRYVLPAWVSDGTLAVPRTYATAIFGSHFDADVTFYFDCPVPRLLHTITNFPTHFMKAYKGSGGTSPLILNLGIRRWWLVIFTPLLFYSQERAPVTIYLNAGWAPEGASTFWSKQTYLTSFSYVRWKTLHVLDLRSNCQLALVRPLGLSSLPSGSSTVHYLSIILIIRPCAAFDANNFIK